MRGVWLVPLVLATAVAGCASGRATAAAGCHFAQGMWGPEDIELDRQDPRGPRLIVSSQKRERARPPGAIFSIPLASGGAFGEPKPLTLAGRGERAFHPHGISLVPGAPPLLYVINHVTSREHAVEVFEIDGDTLRFRRPLLTDPLLTTPNDLVALRNGQIYVTNSGAGPSFGGMLAALFGLRHGTVVRFDGRRWSRAAEDIAFANGIAVNTAGDLLYVGGARDKAIHVFPRRPETGEIGERIRTLEIGSGADNLTWADAHTLLAAAHPSIRAFAWHGAGLASTAPSEVYRVDVRDGSVTRAFADDGTNVSAASTAILHDGRLYLGQVINDRVVSCPPR